MVKLVGVFMVSYAEKSLVGNEKTYVADKNTQKPKRHQKTQI